jgi:hypothetical protein
MCKKSKKVKYSKYAQIIDASFKNALSFHNSIEYNRKGELEEVKEKNFIEQQSEHRKMQIEAEFALVLPILEGFAEKMIKKFWYPDNLF